MSVPSYLHSIRRTAGQLCTDSICGKCSNICNWHHSNSDSWFVYFCSRCVKLATSPFTWLWIISGEMVSCWAFLCLFSGMKKACLSHQFRFCVMKWYTFKPVTGPLMTICSAFGQLIQNGPYFLQNQDQRVEDFLCRIRTPSPGYFSLYPAPTTHMR